MYSEKAVTTIEACRFCPMCRHLCPIGLKTGNEGNTPRGKALLANYVIRGMEYTGEMASDMYECCLCYACAMGCETGFEPPLFIREARTQAVVDGLAPPHVQKVIDNIEATDNIFGLPHKEKFAALGDAVKGLPAKADVLLYIGSTAAYKTPEIPLAVLKLLKKAGISFTVLQEEPSSGTELGDLVGFVDDVRKVAEKCAQRINDTGAKEIVVLDANSARIFKQQYEEWGIRLSGTVVTATAYFAKLVAAGKLSPRKVSLSATFQDDSTLTRELDETEPVRDILKALGVELKEMFLNRKQVKSGGTVLLNEYAPRLTQLAGEGRWADVLRAKVPVLLTATPDSYYVMTKTAPGGVEIKDVFVLLEQNCLNVR
jgi:Fe-S oxidoreductase